jgi:hypothetical protein
MTGGFNQPTLVDIDADGDLDLFVSVLYPLERIDNFRLYENRGTPQEYDFQLVTKNYLSMLDFGLQAAPAFADIDGDADPDLFIGDLDGHVALLRNTGTMESPAFDLEDSVFISSTSVFTYAPAFADIDADADLDMFLGHFIGKIEFHRNDGTPTAPFFQRIPWKFDTTTVGNYASPSFFDADADGDLDLFIGKGQGTVTQYRNDGTAQSAHFTLVSTSFLGINVGLNAKPHFADVDGDTQADLLVGASDGLILYYHNDGPPGNPTFSLVTTTFGDVDSVREAAPIMTDIDNDGDQDLMLGNYRGGVEFYRNAPATSVPPRDAGQYPIAPRLLSVYPNPFNSRTTIVFELPRTATVELRIFDVLGREVSQRSGGTYGPGRHHIGWDASDVATGIYFYRLTALERTLTGKVVLLR